MKIASNIRSSARPLPQAPSPALARTVATVAASLALATVMAASPASAAPKTVSLPADSIQLKESSLPGYDKARAQCVACHSAEYMATQPPSAARPYWENMVKRMKTVFKAPIEDADMPDLVDYLVKTYGNERSGS